MTVNLAKGIRRRTRAPLAAAAALLLAGCAVSVDSGVTTSGTPSFATYAATGVSVLLRFGDRVATATLAETPQAQQLASMLPLTVQLTDAWGQAMSGPLPLPLTVEGATLIHDPVPGNIYYWPPTDAIAIYYDDLEQAVPDAGLVRLGVVEAGLDSLADAGRRVTVRIELAAPSARLLQSNHPANEREAF